MTKGTKIYIGIAAALILVFAAFSGGFIAGIVTNSVKGGDLTLNTPLLNQDNSVSATPQNGSDSDIQNLFKPFWQSWNLVHELFVDQPVDDTQLMRGAIQGMLDSLNDKHTGYIEPELLRQENAQLEGEYEGIGAYVDTSGDNQKFTRCLALPPKKQA